VPRRCRRRATTSVSPVVIHLNLGPCRPRVQAFSFRSGYFLRLHFSASPSSLLRCCLFRQCLSARRYQHIGHTPVPSQHYRASSAVPNSYLMLSSSAIRLATLSVHDYMTREPNFYAFGLLKVPTHMLPVSSVGLNIFRFLPNKLTESLLLQMPSA
jgi:hypothetical protein